MCFTAYLEYIDRSANLKSSVAFSSKLALIVGLMNNE